MPYINNNGIRIHYQIEPSTSSQGLEGNANPHLLLLHGFMQSLEDWRQSGYVKPLAQDHSLVLVDARGHGASDKPHLVAEYGMEALVSDLIAALDQENVAQVNCLGYSFGGWVGFGLAKYVPSRIRSLIVGGMHPYIRDPGPLNRRIERFSQTRDALAAGGHHADLIPAHVKDQFKNNDIEGLIALTSAIRDAPSFEDGIKLFNGPGLIYAGDKDPAYALARQCAVAQPNFQFLSLPGLGHNETWQRSDLVLPSIQNFLAEIS